MVSGPPSLLAPYTTPANAQTADTHLWQDYFTEIRRLHYAHEDADRTLYACPIIFDRNSHESPILVRCADLLWGFAGLSTMYPGSAITIPTSVYSLPLSLAEKVGGWDSDPTAIGEDMHMLLKCYFETAGNLVSRVVHVPASQCNVSGDESGPDGKRKTLSTYQARYRQALRHMWGGTGLGLCDSTNPKLPPSTQSVSLPASAASGPAASPLGGSFPTRASVYPHDLFGVLRDDSVHHDGSSASYSAYRLPGHGNHAHRVVSVDERVSGTV